MTEETNLFMVMLRGDIEGARDAELVRLALDSAGRSGKHVLVGLGEVNFMNTALLFELLTPAHRGKGQLPWLCGPLSQFARHTLEVTGTASAFQIFPTLSQALTAATHDH
ncbi:hypothetical protein ACFRAA_32650 [[Kitasatospora] papulosa]|uniref:hypothetical protein n=1 Tax=[Kitasatospora] papulosa TaxID=1464011 RepID=UPI003634D3D6